MPTAKRALYFKFYIFSLSLLWAGETRVRPVMKYSSLFFFRAWRQQIADLLPPPPPPVDQFAPLLLERRIGGGGGINNRRMKRKGERGFPYFFTEVGGSVLLLLFQSHFGQHLL